MISLLSCLVIDIAANGADAPKAGSKFTFVTDEWPGYTERNGSGHYSSLIEKIFGKDNFSITLMPWKRARAEFAKGKFDGIIGEDNLQQCQYPKWPIDTNKMGVFYRKEGLAKYEGVKSLQGKKVIWVRGYDLHKFGDVKADWEVDNALAGMKMITAGRADALIDYAEDMQAQFEKDKISKEKFAIEDVEFSAGGIYVCFNGPKAKENAAKFDSEMNRLDESGQLLAHYKQWSTEAYYHMMKKFKSK
jgi:ABC-type amino acid transport substrate-binding protein